jgi:hypothetical protein
MTARANTTVTVWILSPLSPHSPHSHTFLPAVTLFVPSFSHSHRCDRVIIPVHEGNHWTALMVDVNAHSHTFLPAVTLVLPLSNTPKGVTESLSLCMRATTGRH